MTNQREQIERVTHQIAKHVTTFLNAHLNQEFHVEDLRKYVYANVRGYVAPASPDRILRDLRQRKQLNYKVISRSKSLYRALPLETPRQESLFQ